jgi:conjugative transposon TraN protein
MKNIVIVAAAMLLVSSAKAQQTYQELEQITVNEQVTTLVTASEPILFVDVSTDKVAGDKPIENTVRFKPKDAEHTDGEVLAIATIVTERYRTQYALVYTTKMTEAVTDKEIAPDERTAYRNPAVSLSTEDMTKFARRVWNSPAKIHNVKAKSNRMLMRLNNIYAVGEYFFLDFSVDNRTNIRFDIDELRVKLVDKKVQKATNNQTIELPLALVLDHSRSFLHGYRNVIVFKKMTFPNDKVVTIELSEKQISGRAISISVDYEDVLSADAFDRVLLEEE